jgi:two-component system nitrate/nitrite response regulator NarL
VVKRCCLTAVIASDGLFGAGLARILRSTPYVVVATAPSLLKLRSSPKRPPALFILALSENELTSPEVIKQVRLVSHDASVAVLGDACNVAACEDMLRAGAAAYLTRSIAPDAFVKALDLVRAGEVVISPELARHLLGKEQTIHPNSVAYASDASNPLDDTARRLSFRESEILQRIVQGDSNKHIGRHFDIAETTVKVHVKSILRKINARNRTQAAIWAFNHPAAAALEPVKDSEPRNALSGPHARVVVPHSTLVPLVGHALTADHPSRGDGAERDRDHERLV